MIFHIIYEIWQTFDTIFIFFEAFEISCKFVVNSKFLPSLYTCGRSYNLQINNVKN